MLYGSCGRERFSLSFVNKSATLLAGTGLLYKYR